MIDLLSFQGRVVVVSGGAQGIGLATSRTFAELGASVVITDVDGEKLEEAVRSITAAGGTAVGIRADITSPESTQQVAEAIARQFGCLDVLINCAAIAAVKDIVSPFVKMERPRWQRLIDVNLTGTLTMTQSLLPLMLERGRGAIVNVISDSYKGLDYNMAVYAASKAGVAAFTKSLAREVGPLGIRVNGVSPSATRTRSTQDMLDQANEKLLRLYPLRRFGEPEDQARAIVFLASDAAGWVTGQILSVNGGYS